MTEKETKRKELREKIKAMTKEEKMKRLDELSTEIFTMANSFAGDKTGAVACYLHESVNNIWKAQKVFGSKTESKIPIEFVAESMGLGVGSMLKRISDL